MCGAELARKTDIAESASSTQTSRKLCLNSQQGRVTSAGGSVHISWMYTQLI